MTTSSPKKNKIDLNNYNYTRDIEHRLLMAQLSTLELEILQEILNSSLKFTTTQLADALDLDMSSVLPALNKFSATKLLQVSGGHVVVDKELRKYYEGQILKFDRDFEPGMEFLQSLLSKVPIHVLPNWYSISRTSDHIFHSIIEKYLQTPKIFERYLEELTFDEPELAGIFRDILKAPDFKLSSRILIEKYTLSHERFEQLMLILEFSMLCCLSYEMIDGKWEEVVTPFHEYREYLRFTRDTAPHAIDKAQPIQRLHSTDFGYAEDLTLLLHAMSKNPLPLETDANRAGYSLSLPTAKAHLPHFVETPFSASYLSHLTDRLLQLQLARIVDNELHITPRATDWLTIHIQDKALSLCKLPPARNSIITTFSEKDVRTVEKNLRRITHKGWVLFDNFFAGMTVAIGDTEAVSLVCKGKRWKYQIPSYSDQERAFVKAVICESFFETGIVSLGFFEGQLCFALTPFGRMSIGG